MTPAILAFLLGGAGLIAGVGLGRVSLRLPRDVAGASPGPRRYALMALAAAAIGVWAALARAAPLDAVLTALLGWQLLLIAVIDGEHFRLPDRLTLPLLATGGLAAMVLDSFQVGLADGPTDIHKVTLAKQLLRGRKHSQGLFPDYHIPARRAAALAKYGLSGEEAGLKAAVA